MAQHNYILPIDSALARDRALTLVRARLIHARTQVQAQNYGLADEALATLIHDLTDDQGPCYIVRKELDLLGAR